MGKVRWESKSKVETPALPAIHTQAYPPHLAEHERQKCNCCQFVSRSQYVIHRAGILHKHRNNSCRCGQGSMSRAQVTAAHGEAASWDRGLTHGCFLILVLFSNWQHRCQCKQPGTSRYRFRARLRWNWVMHTKRCPRLCCLACSYFLRRVQGCPTFFIYLLPSRWLKPDTAKKEIRVISP